MPYIIINPISIKYSMYTSPKSDYLLKPYAIALLKKLCFNALTIREGIMLCHKAMNLL